MEDSQFRVLIERLDVIARLLAVNLVKDKAGQKDRILELSSRGLKNSKISDFLGITSNIVRATLSRERKKRTRA